MLEFACILVLFITLFRLLLVRFPGTKMNMEYMKGWETIFSLGWFWDIN